MGEHVEIDDKSDVLTSEPENKTEVDSEVDVIVPDPEGASGAGPEPSGRQLGFGTTVLFTATSLLSSTLLFQVQPLVGRLLLPLAGGTSSLWNTAMVFFQATLLVGYLMAHIGTHKLKLRHHVYTQVAFLAVAALTLPLVAPTSTPSGSPTLWVLLAIAGMVGLPFLVLSTSSPTLQRWLSTTNHPSAEDPYFLYAAGNFGSLVALMAYPLVLERTMTLGQQITAWSIGFGLLIVATLVCGVVAFRSPKSEADIDVDLVEQVMSDDDVEPHKQSPRTATLTWRRRLTWIATAAVPSALLLGVTRHITTDVAPFPLLWILPLVLFLGTFVVAFSSASDSLGDRLGLPVRLAALALVVEIFIDSESDIFFGLIVHLVGFFVLVLGAHVMLAQDRPSPERLTEFYLWLSFGGVIGGASAALLAPVVTDWAVEYPLGIAASVALTYQAKMKVTPGLYRIGGVVATLGLLYFAEELPERMPLLLLGLLAAVIILVKWSQVVGAVTIAVLLFFSTTLVEDAVRFDRSFFGIYRVEETSTTRYFYSGTTIHGRQSLDELVDPTATSYYHPAGPVGDMVRSLQEQKPEGITLGVIGLGAGETAAYGRPQDKITFYEIDPKVVEIAHESGLFTYTQESKAEVEIKVGDGRIELDRSEETYDVLLIDAFSSDAIPVHLMTTEALEIYLSKLNPGGVLALHVTNRHLELGPVVANLAQDNQVPVRNWSYSPDEAAREENASFTRWVAIAKDTEPLDGLAGPWEGIESSGRLWTDDFADVLDVVEFD